MKMGASFRLTGGTTYFELRLRLFFSSATVVFALLLIIMRGCVPTKKRFVCA